MTAETVSFYLHYNTPELQGAVGTGCLYRSLKNAADQVSRGMQDPSVYAIERFGRTNKAEIVMVENILR